MQEMLIDKLVEAAAQRTLRYKWKVQSTILTVLLVMPITGDADRQAGGVGGEEDASQQPQPAGVHRCR